MHGCLCQGTWRYFVGGEPLWSVIIWRIFERCETIQFFSLCMCKYLRMREQERKENKRKCNNKRNKRKKKLKTQGLIFCSIDVAKVQLLLQLLLKKRNVTKLKHSYIYNWIQLDIFWTYVYFLNVFLTQTFFVTCLSSTGLISWKPGKMKMIYLFKMFNLISHPACLSLCCSSSLVLSCPYMNECTQMSILRAVESQYSHWFFNDDRTSWGK